MKYLVFNIGCIECGVSSNVVGVFEDEIEANKYANMLKESKDFSWREGGQNSYEVFPMPEDFFINDEYKIR